MEWSGQIDEFSACSAERVSEAGDYLLHLCKVWKVFPSVEMSTWGTYSLLVDVACPLSWEQYIPDHLLWPCRQVLGPRGDEPIAKSGQAKTRSA